MESSILIASGFEIKSVPELLEQICQFVQSEIKSDSLPPLPIVTFCLGNGSKFTGIPLKVFGRDLRKQIFILTSDPVERPIDTAWIPFAEIQSLQISRAESISHLLVPQKADEEFVSGVTILLSAIRKDFQIHWKNLAVKNSLLPHVYFNWDEIGKSEFEKQNIVIFTTALMKAIDTVTIGEIRRAQFNRINTLQVSMGTGKDVQFDKQGAFLVIHVNFKRAASPNLEQELVMALNDVFAS